MSKGVGNNQYLGGLFVLGRLEARYVGLQGCRLHSAGYIYVAIGNIGAVDGGRRSAGAAYPLFERARALGMSA